MADDKATKPANPSSSALVFKRLDTVLPVVVVVVVVVKGRRVERACNIPDGEMTLSCKDNLLSTSRGS